MNKKRFRRRNIPFLLYGEEIAFVAAAADERLIDVFGLKFFCVSKECRNKEFTWI